NAEAFEAQAASHALECPICTSADVHKALMAPAVSKSRNQTVSLTTGHPEHHQIRAEMRRLRKKLTSNAEYVGDKFAAEARRIHLQEAESRGIYGEATHDEVIDLVEDGVDFMPLPNLPEEHN
ncbi:MAG TPA: DUF1178 family protein, partial [Devosiaceae bacterium]|nr:DUF1178 family protein [Devosiaceae bacterium]